MMAALLPNSGVFFLVLPLVLGMLGLPVGAPRVRAQIALGLLGLWTVGIAGLAVLLGSVDASQSLVLSARTGLNWPGNSPFDVPFAIQLTPPHLWALVVITGLLLVTQCSTRDDASDWRFFQEVILTVLAVMGWTLLILATHFAITLTAFVGLNGLAFAWQMVADDRPSAGRTAQRHFLSVLPGDLLLIGFLVTVAAAAGSLENQVLWAPQTWHSWGERLAALPGALGSLFLLGLTFRLGLFPFLTWRDTAEEGNPRVGAVVQGLLLSGPALWLWIVANPASATVASLSSLGTGFGALTCLMVSLFAASPRDPVRLAAWVLSWQAGWLLICGATGDASFVILRLVQIGFVLSGFVLIVLTLHRKGVWLHRLGWLVLLGVFPAGTGVTQVLLMPEGAPQEIVVTEGAATPQASQPAAGLPMASLLAGVGWVGLAVQAGPFLRRPFPFGGEEQLGRSSRDVFSIGSGGLGLLLVVASGGVVMTHGLELVRDGELAVGLMVGSWAVVGLGVLAAKPGSSWAFLPRLWSAGPLSSLAAQRFLLNEVWFLCVNLPPRAIGQLLRFFDWFVADFLAAGLWGKLSHLAASGLRSLQTGVPADYVLTAVLSVVVMTLTLLWSR